MFSLSLVWFFLKRTSKFLSLIFGIISFFLILFIQFSCLHPSQSENYALNLQLNKESSIFSIINNTFNTDNYTKEFSELQFKIGMSGVCIEHLPVTIDLPFVNSLECYKHNFDFKNLTIGKTNFYELMNIIIVSSNTAHLSTTNLTLSNPELNLLNLSAYMKKSIHSKVTTTSLVFQSISLLTVVLSLLPKPCNLYWFQSTISLIIYLILHFVSLIIWGINAVLLLQVTDKAYSKFLTKMSLNIITAKSNRSFQCMLWVGLVFHFLQLCGLINFFVRYFYKLNEEDEEIKNFSDISKKNSNTKSCINFNKVDKYSNPFVDQMYTSNIKHKGDNDYEKYQISNKSRESSFNFKRDNDMLSENTYYNF
ncbi:hypothetical protein QEN19_000992 [Hanseniaspora menglaensis]